MTEELIIKLSTKINNDLEEAIVQTVKSEFPYIAEYEINAKKIVEALEKQIPKKVIDYAYDDCWYACGNCKTLLEIKGNKVHDWIYCPTCGQKLDWSEYKE